MKLIIQAACINHNNKNPYIFLIKEQKKWEKKVKIVGFCEIKEWH